MEDAIRKLTEIAEHLVYSHTFRSEHTARRARQLLAGVRADLDGVAHAPIGGEAAEEARDDSA